MIQAGKVLLDRFLVTKSSMVRSDRKFHLILSVPDANHRPYQTNAERNDRER
jgi:hypothetical protein